MYSKSISCKCQVFIGITFIEHLKKYIIMLVVNDRSKRPQLKHGAVPARGSLTALLWPWEASFLRAPLILGSH